MISSSSATLAAFPRSLTTIVALYCAFCSIAVMAQNTTAPPTDAKSAAALEAQLSADDIVLKEMDESLNELTRLTDLQTGRVTVKAQPPLTTAQALTEFEKRDKERLAAKSGSEERARAASAAMDLAARISWASFDAGKYDEAAAWSERRAQLQKESYHNWRSWHIARVVALGKRADEVNRAKQDIASPLSKATESYVRMLVSALLNVQVTHARGLQHLAMENNDSATQLEYSQIELAIRRVELERVPKDAPPTDVYTAKARISSALEYVAGARQASAQFDEAEKTYTQALEMRRELPVDFLGRELHNPLRSRGSLRTTMGDWKGAREDFEAALVALDETVAAFEKVPAEQQVAQLRTMSRASHAMSRAVFLNNLGGIAISMGEYQNAHDYLNRALQAVENLPRDHELSVWVRTSMRASALGNIAVAFGDAGETDKALKMMDEIIALRRATGDEIGAATTLLNQAGLFVEKGDKESAAKFIMQARQTFLSQQHLPGVIPTTIFLASQARDKNQLDEAVKYAQEALVMARQTNDPDLIGSTARGLASVRMAQNKFDESLALLQEAETADKRIGSPLSLERTLDKRGQVFEKQGDLAGALKQYQEAIKLLESVRASTGSQSAFSDLQNNYEVYERAVRVLIKLQRTDEAFDYLTRAKSKKLNDTMRLSSIKSGDKATQQLLDLAGALEKKLDGLRAQLQSENALPTTERDTSRIQNLKLVSASTQAEFFDVVNKIKAVEPNYEKIVTIKPKELKKAQRSIPRDAILVQYAPLGDQLYIFLVTQDSLKIYTPPTKPDQIWKRVREFRRLMDEAKERAARGEDIAVREWNSTEARTQQLRENLTALYDILIAPIEPEIKDKKVVAFIPTQMLYYLPIHALARKTENGLKFIVEEKQIAYLAGADVLSVVQEQDTSLLGRGLLALGNPTGADLPSAQNEVQNIAKIFPATQVLSGAAATKAALSQTDSLNKRVLHFATHGVLNAMTPDKSYIQLAPGAAPDDYKLTVGEVYGLDLNKIDLVTLSACQTALGERNPDGSEITSLAEAFSGAGAPSVVASLWSVSDSSTEQTMVAFYEQLAAGNSKVSALQAAQLKVMRNPKYAHPFYWAPFVLLGDWR